MSIEDPLTIWDYTAAVLRELWDEAEGMEPFDVLSRFHPRRWDEARIAIGVLKDRAIVQEVIRVSSHAPPRRRLVVLRKRPAPHESPPR